MDKLKSTGMILTGALATSAIDSSGEVLDIDGADISLLQEKKGFVNIEHIMPEDDDQESTPVEAEEGEKLVGKIIFARKIKSLEDCQDEDQRRWWKVYKLPMIYGAVRLFDGAGHKNAQAIAAVIRDHIANNEPLEVGFSVEGATLKRDGYKLKETIIRGVALTVKPCNKSATADLVYDPKAPEGYQVLPQGKAIFKSEDAIYTKLGGARGIVSPDLLKAMSAGSYNSAPGTLTGGAALQVEDKNLRATAKAAVRDWPKTGPFKAFLKSYLEKNNIGDASDEFLNHYSDLVESKYWRIKKSQEVLNDLKKKGKEVAPKKASAPTGFTNNGAPVKPNPKLAGAKFDEKSGTLHIPEGSFKVYIPSRDPDKNVGDAFHGIMQDPKVEQFHGYAMENWAKAHKLLKAGKLPPEVAMHSVLFSQLSPNCLDAETEALTQRGWVKGFDLTLDDTLLTKNQVTGQLEWHKPTDLRLFPEYDGELIKISTRSFEVVTTPEHRWLVTTQRGHQRIHTSKDLVNGDKIHRTGEYTGPVDSGLSDDEAELLGWFVTDGHWGKSTNFREHGPQEASSKSKYEVPGLYARLTQSYVGNPEKCSRIAALVGRLTDEASLRKDQTKNTDEWTLGPKLTKMLLARAPDRHLTITSLLDLSKTALERLYESMLLGDGNSWTDSSKNWKVKKQLTTGRKEQAEAFQCLLTLLGKASSCVWRDMSKYEPKSPKMANIPRMTGVYVVTELNRKFVNFNPTSRTSYKAKEGVWCPMVPNEVFVARRKGQVFCTLNTPVPMQELMYGALVDQMNHSGKDALHPDFASNRNDWLNRDQPEKFPDHSPEHWKRLEDSLRIKTDSKTTGRPAGSIGSFMLANNKFENMEQYHKMHAPLMQMLANSKGDVRSVADQMMHQKNEQVKWNNRRRIALAAGKPDPGEYPGMSIAGLAPKTTRYALAMMGGGNVHVPDTHFVRNLFGLNRDLDSKSIQAIKNHLWNEKNSHVLNGIDRYYANNHDAVRHMLQHPTWGKVFEKPEDAIFPAFWKHWMGIVPHEKARGHTINGYNELTDHKPYWEAIAPFMKNDSNHSLPMQTARQHAEWQLQYGEIPAQMLYFRYLLPKLLGPAAQRESQAIVRKAQNLQVERLAKQDRKLSQTPGSEPVKQNSIELAHGLGRAVQQAQPFSQASNKENWMQMMDNVASAAGVPNIADKNKQAIDKGHIVNFQGRKYKPGSAIDIDKGDGYTLLGHDATHFYAVPDKIDITRGWTDKDLKKLPRHSENLEVYHYPESVDEPLTVDIGRHGVAGMNERPESQALAHGFVFGGPKKLGGGATGNAGDSYWSKTPDGKNVFVKKASTVFNNHTEAPDNTARREGIYANLAHNFFGLGQHLPNVAVVKHPQTGQEHALIEHVPGTHTHSHSDSEVKQALKNVNKNGDLHKIAMMNYIMGNSDRHSGNFMLTSSNPDLGPDGIKLIDHNIFGSKRVTQTPSYLAYMNDDSTGEGNDIMHKMHPEAEKWLMSLDPAELRQQLMANHMPPYSIDRSVQRLQRMRNYASVAPNLWEVLQYSDAPDEAPERGSYNPVWSSDVKDSDDSR